MPTGTYGSGASMCGDSRENRAVPGQQPVRKLLEMNWESPNFEAADVPHTHDDSTRFVDWRRRIELNRHDSSKLEASSH